MAITDNAFTQDEFNAAIEANPDLITHVTTSLTGRDFVVRAKADNEQFLRNYEAQVVGNKTKEHASAIEKDVFELTGIQKEGDEKYYDYMKRAFSTTKGTLEKVTQELADARKNGTDTAAERKRIEALENKLTEAQKAHNEALGAKDKQISQVKAQRIVDGTLAKLRTTYKPTLSEGIIEMVEGTIVGNLMNNSALRKDSADKEIVVFLDNEGNVRQDPTTLAPLTPQQVLTEALKELIDEGRKQDGTGTDPKKQGAAGTEGGAQGGTGKFTTLPADVKTKTQLTDYLLKLGIADGTPEFNKIFAEHGAKLPLR